MHEVKFDGYRALSYIKDGDVRIYTRNKNDWTQAFKPIADLLSTLPFDAVIDGEIVVADEKGISSFKMLQEALSEGKLGRLQYYVFDLLYLDGELLTSLPLIERKEKLKKIIAQKDFSGRIIYSEHFAGKDKKFLDHICSLQMEGVISKLVGSTYRGGRGKSWLKTKCHLRQEFVVGGFTLPTHEERGIGAL